MEKIRKMIYIGNAKKTPVGEVGKFLCPVGDKGYERPGILIHLEDGSWPTTLMYTYVG